MRCDRCPRATGGRSVELSRRRRRRRRDEPHSGNKVKVESVQRKHDGRRSSRRKQLTAANSSSLAHPCRRHKSGLVPCPSLSSRSSWPAAAVLLLLSLPPWSSSALEAVSGVCDAPHPPRLLTTPRRLGEHTQRPGGKAARGAQVGGCVAAQPRQAASGKQQRKSNSRPKQHLRRVRGDERVRYQHRECEQEHCRRERPMKLTLSARRYAGAVWE